MAKIVSISINTTDSNAKKQVTNVNYVNPAVENDKLRQFAQMLVALTIDSYVGVTKITKESVI